MNLTNHSKSGRPRMPVMFVGHGNPMHAISDNEFSRGWQRMAGGLAPKAIVCISAHWETRGTRVTMAPKPKTIHDFGGFPPELHAVQYPAPGAPDLGNNIINTVKGHTVAEDHEWGLDHGAWSVIRHMFPKADVPAIQLSLDRNMAFGAHYELGQELAFLRRQGVLVIGSGNIVHNLRRAKWDSNEPYDWALEFDELSRKLILDGNHAALIKGGKLNSAANLSIPTPEHFLPLLYVLALKKKGEEVSFFNERIDMGSMSMRSLVIS